MENLKNLYGLESLFNVLPPEYRHWNVFTKILSFGYKRETDPETQENIYNARMLLTDADEKYKICLDIKNIGGNIDLTIGEDIDIFDIVDMSMYGYEDINSLRIVDRGETELNFYCEAVYASIAE